MAQPNQKNEVNAGSDDFEDLLASNAKDSVEQVYSNFFSKICVFV